MGLANIQHQPEVAATITRAVLDLIYQLFICSIVWSMLEMWILLMAIIYNCNRKTLLTLYVALKIHAVI